MKKNRNGNKESYKSKIHRSNILMICVVIGSILFFNAISYYYIKCYTDAVGSLNNLSSFYSDNELYVQYFKEYLHTDNEIYYDHVQDLERTMEEKTSWLIEEASPESEWKFRALKNMFDAHTDTADKLVYKYRNTIDDYELYYDQFLHEDELIQDTTKEYYSLLTETINGYLSDLKKIAVGAVIISLVDFAVIVIWLLYYSHQLVRFFAKPLELISDNINMIRQGKYSLPNISGSGKEMEDICNALNDMSQVVQQNMKIAEEKSELEKKLLISENEILKRDERLAASELRMLQNQINPHFLFNTLNMICRMSLNEGAADASDMLMKTSRLLRYALDSQKHTSTLGEEISIIRQYIDIQTKRLGDRVRFVVEYNCECLGSLKMPGMIFQPLVENALIHGLHDEVKNGEITVRAESDGKYLLLSVSDNGKGMDPAELEGMVLNDYQTEDGKHLGLYNVVKRMEMFFHDRIMINIYSSEGCGFEVCMEIKLQNGMQVNGYGV